MRHYILGNVVDEISIRENNPSTSDYERFVGLEHYVSGEVEIVNYGTTANLNSAMKVFQEGDILVARRNVYLKRASVVYFDGLTSGDSIVLRAKDETIGRILPFILNTEEFWDYAEKHSDGTMSKRLSPKVLKNYEFDLPEDSLDELADLLWSMVDTKNAYKELLKKTDDLVKSQFIEMFGELGKDQKGWGLTTLGECCEVNPKRPRNIDEELMVSFVPMPSVSEDGKIDCSNIKPYKEVRKGFTYFAENDVLFAKITPCMENGKGAVAKGLSGGIGSGSTEFHVLRPIEGKSNPYWLYIITMFELFRVGARKVMTGTGGQLRVPVGYLSDFPISLPPISLQDSFEEFVHQSDKSKFYGKSQFIEMFGDPVYNTMDWPTKPIKDIAPESNACIPEENEYWWLNLDMIESYSGMLVDKVIEKADAIGNSTHAFDSSMVLYSKLRPYLNKTIVPDGYGYATTELVCLKPNPVELNKYFLFNLLRGDCFLDFATKCSSGAQMPRMPMRMLREFPCILPPMELQNKFVEFSEQSDKSKFEIQKTIDSTTDLIKSVLYNAIHE